MKFRTHVFGAALSAVVLLPCLLEAQSPRARLLVNAAWLAQHVNDTHLILLHVGDRAEYEREHIPGARFINQRDLAAPQPAGEHRHDQLILELPDPAAARAKLEALGVTDKSRIIVYYGNDWVSPATRVVFTLDWLGLGDRTSLLDGGMRAWKNGGGAVTAELPAIKPGKLAAKKVKPLVVERAWLAANLKNPKLAIIDARTRNFYDGIGEGPRPGHIAGAGSLPFTQVTDDALLFKPPQELAVLFEKAGFQKGKTIIGYCHIGQQATAMLFAARTLGYDIRLYDGSYTEWERYPELPVEKATAGTR